MPRVFRVMKRDNDERPTVMDSSQGLGIRPGTDVDEDELGNVVVNGKGMSVSPSLRDLPRLRLPKRLHDRFPGARGSNSTSCFRTGTGSFQAGPFAPGLDLVPDSQRHGCVTPARSVPLSEYQDDLAATRDDWEVDED